MTTTISRPLSFALIIMATSVACGKAKESKSETPRASTEGVPGSDGLTPGTTTAPVPTGDVSGGGTTGVPAGGSVPVSVAPPATVLGEFDFELQGIRDSDDGACSTGVQRSTTLRRMCLKLQDEAAVQGCARKERIRLFFARCQEFEWLESSRCDVELHKAGADLSLLKEPDPASRVTKESFCVGRGSLADATLIDLHGVNLHPGVNLNLNARFEQVFDHLGRREATNSWSIELVSPLGQSLMRPIENRKMDNFVSFGSLEDNSYKYRIACRAVPSCDL